MSFSSNGSLITLFLSKKKMKTQNATAYSYHSKVTSTQNKGVSFFSCLGHGVQLEAAIQRCSVKKVFLEISHNLQENTCARVSFFNKVAGLRPRVCTFIKKRLWHRYFHVKFAKFLRILLVAASVQYCTSCLSKVLFV